MAFDQFLGKQTFSGADIMVIFSVAGATNLSYGNAKGFTISSTIQTLTVSSTTSVLPVRRCGEARPRDFSRGARTFAGSMVFTIMDSDPFKEVFAIDSYGNSVANDDSWHIDQMPPFDIIVVAANETGGVGAQIISNARIVNWGTTYSVDDIYTEATYTYIAEHVTPFLVAIDGVPVVPQFSKTLSKTPDEQVIGSSWAAKDNADLLREAIQTFKPGTATVLPNGSKYNQFSDPCIPPELLDDVLRSNGNDQ